MEVEKTEGRLALALADLVRQIDIAEYRDARGHPMKNNLAFIRAQALVDEYGVTHDRVCQALDNCDGDMAVAAKELLSLERFGKADRHA